MRQLFRAKPKTFLDAPRREWQFQAYAWLLRGCGGFPKFVETLLVLPSEEHFPDRDLKGHAAAAALFRRVRDHAGMADWPCVAEPTPRDPARTPADRIRVIHYPPGEHRPDMLAAHFAHELARYLVESLDETPPGGAMLYEPAVDLTTVFMGFGVFMANSSAGKAAWDLNESELTHALAMFCLLRKLPVEAVDPYLNAHVRKYLRLAARDLARFEPDFVRLRSTFGHASFDVGECTLPAR